MSLKHRGNSKIKREHDTIQGLDKYLSSIEGIGEIKAIIPGVITIKKGATCFEFSVQRETGAGLRCLAKNQGAVQTVYITTSEPLIVWQKIEGDV